MVKQHIEVSDRILLDLNMKTQIHVLHVDDDAGFLKVSKQILELEEDLTVGTASSVEEAFEKMKHNVYDAIVSDLEMPGENGLDFLEKLRASGSSVPFVLFTGKGREEIAVKAFNLGADGYFNKSGCPETVFGELAYGIRNSVKIKHAEQSSKDSENKYRVLLMNLLNGFAYCKTVFDEKGKPVDFVFLEVNRAFEKMMGLKRENIIGKNVTTVIPGVEKFNPELFDSYDRVAKTGKEDKFEVFFKPLNRWLSISTYSPNKGYFVAIFDDTTEHRSIETEMRKSELILQNISDSIIVTDLQGQVTSWNKGASLIFGFSAEEMLGEPIAKICKPKEREQVVSAQLEQVRKGDVFSQQWEGVRKDGTPVWLLLTTTLLKNTQNETVGMIGVGKDITERKKTEEALKRTEEKLREVFAASPDPITVSDLNGSIVECNQAAVALHGGQSKEELIGKNSLELIAKKDHKRAIENMKDTLMHGSVKNIEYACLTKDGREFPVELSASVMRDTSGKPEYFMAITKDITERKKTQQALQASEEKHRIISGLSTDVVFSCLKMGEGSFVIDWMMGATEKVFGYSAKKMMDEGCWKFVVQPQDRPKFDERVTGLEPGQSSVCELRITHKDGSTRWLRIFSHVEDADNPVNHRLFGACTDITESKKVRGELKKSEEKYRRQFEEALDAVFLTDTETGILVDCNRAACELVGREKSEILGKHQRILHPPEEVEGEFNRTFTEHVDKNLEQVLKSRVVTKNGEIRDVEVKVNFFELEDKRLLRSSFRDVTDSFLQQELLRQSEEKFRKIVENSQDAVMLTEPDGVIRYISPACSRVLGHPPEDLIGKGPGIIHPDDQDKVKNVFGQALEGMNGSNFEYRVVTKDGKTKWISHSWSPTLENGRPVSIVSVLRDISENRALEQQMRIKEAALASSVSAVAFASLEGKLTYVNNSFLLMWGYVSIDEVLGRPINEFWASQEKAAEIVKTLEHENGWVGALTAKKKDGSTFEAQLSANMVKDKTGKPACMMASFTDVTERKQAEKKLLESEEKFRALFQNANDAIIYLDRSGMILDVNRKTLEVFGGTKEELNGKHFTKTGVFSAKDTPTFLHNFVDLLTGKKAGLTVSVRNRKGQQVDLECSCSPMGSGEWAGMVVVARDVSERGKIEAEQRASEERLRLLFEMAPDAYYLSDLKSNFVDGNKAAEKLMGYTKNELVGKKFLELKLLSRSQIPKAAKLLALNALGRSTGPDEFTLTRKDGSQVQVEMMTHPIKVKGQTLVLGIAHDITDRKNNEQTVQKSEQKFRGLFKYNPEAAVYLDLDFKVLDVNPRFCQLFGYSKEEAKNGKLNDLIVPENLVDEAERLDKDAQNGYASHDSFRKRKDGSLVSVSISATPLTIEDKIVGYIGIYKDITKLAEAYEEVEEARKHFQTLFDLMADPVCVISEKGIVLDVTQKLEEVFGFQKEELVGKHFGQTGILSLKAKETAAKTFSKRMMGYDVPPYMLEMLTKKGKEVLVEINARVIPYKGERATLNVLRDVSERKKLEEKLRVVGSLTRHDVRNKLSAVTGNAYLLKRKLAADPEALGQIGDMEGAVGEVEKIFEFARVYEKLGVEQLTGMDVAVAFDEAAALFSRVKGVRMVNECQGVTVLADSLLRQLFYNLIDDSLKYGEKVGQIRVHCRESSEGKLEIVYEDDGVGVPETVRSNLFKEGYGKGTGYGLFLIRRICEVYGWTIRETGKQGQGAQFTLTTPPREDQTRAAQPSPIVTTA